MGGPRVPSAPPLWLRFQIHLSRRPLGHIRTNFTGMTVMSQTFQISRDIHVEIWKIPRGFFKFLENDPIRGPNTPFEAEFSEIFKFRNNIENQSLLPQKPSRNGNSMWASLHAGVSRRSLTNVIGPGVCLLCSGRTLLPRRV